MDAAEMRVESAGVAPVEPVIRTRAAAHVTGEVLGRIRWLKSKLQLMRVRRVRDG